ncbi:uncharacterized protein LOC122274565 [Carya illinoinensis]|uniref:uncharacterized protein LOC122274565 n=1 Tax=Carya illinoinensis TaxID=32201 RepID=UPI001C721001|nr:uncharacterized protein LOC122274565 [Carya illinoinensis]
MGKFWWGSSNNKQKVQWKSWTSMGVSKKDGGLSFRDLESFNKAMLAKQVWRVLNNPNSLVAQLLKQKYFKRGSILNSKKGTNSSLVWDPSVSELIDEGECRWKKEVLDQLFHEEDVEKICQIPLSKTGTQDKLMWGYTTNGCFTVRSAYYLQQSLVRQMKGECSSIVNGLIDWKHLWSLNVPMKIKLSVWKAAHNVLPTLQNLASKKIVDGDLCSICKREVESLLHVIWGCPAASDVWAMSNCPIHKWPIFFPDFRTLWFSLRSKLDVDSLQLVVIAATADRDLFLCSLTSTDAVPSNNRSDKGDIRWKKLEVRTLKANWDASVSTKLNRAGYGIIIRDEQGSIMLCVCASHKPIVKPVMAEGLALRRAMEVCVDLGLGRMVFEGDAQIIVQAVTSDEEISADYGVLVNDARSMLRTWTQWHVAFVHREANYAAHQLAKLALDYEYEKIWMEDGPMQVMLTVQLEQSM